VSVVAATLALNRRAITAPGDDGAWGAIRGPLCLPAAIGGLGRRSNLYLIIASTTCYYVPMFCLPKPEATRLWTSTLQRLALPTAVAL
jgi:hypothetical protein